MLVKSSSQNIAQFFNVFKSFLHESHCIKGNTTPIQKLNTSCLTGPNEHNNTS